MPRIRIDPSHYKPDYRTQFWVATLNNATVDDENHFHAICGDRVTQKTRVDWWCHGVEHGPLRTSDWIQPEDYNSPESRIKRIEEGELTPHLQCAFQLSSATRWCDVISWLNKTVQRPMGAWHVEPAQGGLEDQRNYCSKEGNYFESGEAKPFERARSSKQGHRSDYDDIRDEIAKGVDIDELRTRYFSQFAQHERFFINYKGQLNEEVFKGQELTTYENVQWRPWQESIIEIANGPVLNRTLHVIVDPSGNSGKSFLSNYLALKLNFLILNPSSKRDLAYIFTQEIQKGTNVRGVIIDIARSIVGSGMNEHLPNSAMASVYNFVECLHDKRITNTKYESKTMFFPQPHVFMFTNHQVEQFSEYTLSADRWNVKTLDARGRFI